MIYLLTSDGHRDSILLDCYATDEKSIESYLSSYLMDMFDYAIREVQIDLINQIICYKYNAQYQNPEYDQDDWEQGTYHLIAIEEFKKE